MLYEYFGKRAILISVDSFVAYCLIDLDVNFMVAILTNNSSHTGIPRFAKVILSSKITPRVKILNHKIKFQCSLRVESPNLRK
jgi:hypothetical protein